MSNKIYDPYNPENPINKNNAFQIEEAEDTNTIKNPLINIVINKDLEEKLSKCNIDDIPEFSLNSIRTLGKIVDVYDGDTCKIILANGDILMRFNCRLKFIDTPEMKPLRNKPNRDIEIKNAIKCRNKLLQLTTNCQINLEDCYTKPQIKKLLKLNNKIVQVHCHEFDKYGRLLVEIYENNKTVNNILVEEGFAKLYDGKTKDIFTY
jgi:endonuclease YncB( thermonuclease family)